MAMCGIAGYFIREGQSTPGWIPSALNHMNHRGPDSQGIMSFEDGRLYLGHVRLKILDLSDEANQPFIDELGRYSIVFNGEIYNHDSIRKELMADGFTFKTSSDTEVLLKGYIRWGQDIAHRLRGMFAFCIYDGAKKKLFFARDVAGEKPLYLYIRDNTLCFASELRALLKCRDIDRVVDEISLGYYLSQGSVPANRAIIKDILKLPPASCLSYNLETGLYSTYRYHQIGSEHDCTKTGSNDLLYHVDKVEELLTDSISEQLNADVQTGILLSGGLDSSLITGIAAGATSERINTFTVTYHETSAYDESEYAKIVSSHFNTRHHEFNIGFPKGAFFQDLASSMDEPFADSSIVPSRLLCKEVSNYCTVLLGGDGGDELFGGYKHYTRAIRLTELSKYLPSSVARVLAMCEGYIPVGIKGKELINGLCSSKRGHMEYPIRHFDNQMIRRLFPSIRINDNVRKGSIRGESHASSLAGDLCRNDFLNYLPQDILAKTDSASMHYSMELRAPFLDKRIIDYSFRCIPDSLKVNNTSTKILLKELGNKILPKSLKLDRKHGFSFPLSKAFNESELGDFASEIFSSTEFLPGADCRKLLNSVKRGFSNSERVFNLLILEVWMRHNGVRIA